MAENYQVRHVFEDLLKLADQDGIVDMTHEAIARRTNVPIELIRHGISELEKPDKKSRSSVQQGRRLVRLDDHRDWGWQIVNQGYYRKLKNADEMRHAAKERMRNKREPKEKHQKSEQHEQSVTSAYAYTSASKSVPEGDCKGETMRLLQDGLNGLFDRNPSRRWTHAEESTLFEIAKRDGAVEQLADLRNYQRSNGQYFPKSIIALLADWDKFLDQAASFKRETKSKPTAKGIVDKEIDAIERQIKNMQ